MPAGRPTKFRKEYCELLIEHQKKGLSFQCFGVTIGVDRATCDRWVQRYPEFRAAKKTAQEHCLLFWERLGIQGTAGKIKGFNPAVYCFNMKNRFMWRNEAPEPEEDVKPFIIERRDGTIEVLGTKKQSEDEPEDDEREAAH